jgi:hypothetical protein
VLTLIRRFVVIDRLPMRTVDRSNPIFEENYPKDNDKRYADRAGKRSKEQDFHILVQPFGRTPVVRSAQTIITMPERLPCLANGVRDFAHSPLENHPNG